MHRILESQHAGPGDILAHADFVMIAQPHLAADVERAVSAAVVDGHQLPAVAEAVAVIVGIFKVAEIVVVEDRLESRRTRICAGLGGLGRADRLGFKTFFFRFGQSCRQVVAHLGFVQRAAIYFARLKHRNAVLR